jgi:uncharacterized protein YbjT (DUF2867 family)
MALPGSGLLRALFPPRDKPPTDASNSAPATDADINPEHSAQIDAAPEAPSSVASIPAAPSAPGASKSVHAPSGFASQRPSWTTSPSTVVRPTPPPRDARRVLVVGAGGKLGREVVASLARSPVGYTVIGCVRSLDSAPQGCDRVIALDAVGQAPLLAVRARELGVGAVVWCAAAGGGSRNGGGVKPRDVDYAGVRALVNEAVAGDGWLADAEDTIELFDFSEPRALDAWRSVDDVVMGGMSKSVLQPGNGSAVWNGDITLARLGGFVSTRASLSNGIAGGGADLSSCAGIAITCKGDGKRYKINLKNDSRPEFTFQASFDALPVPMQPGAEQQWQTVRLPFSDFVPVIRGKLAYSDNPTNGSIYSADLDTSSIVSIGLVCSKIEPGGLACPLFTPGPFALELSNITAYRPTPPRFILVSSASVSRPFWDDKKQSVYSAAADIPIVKLNAQIGNVLGAKLAGEDALRASTIPYAVVRPTALRDDIESGKAVRVYTGDFAVGRISRADVARSIVGMLQTQDASWKTVELDSDANEKWSDEDAPELIASALKNVPADIQQVVYPFQTSTL